MSRSLLLYRATAVILPLVAALGPIPNERMDGRTYEETGTTTGFLMIIAVVCCVGCFRVFWPPSDTRGRRLVKSVLVVTLCLAWSALLWEYVVYVAAGVSAATKPRGIAAVESILGIGLMLSALAAVAALLVGFGSRSKQATPSA